MGSGILCFTSLVSIALGGCSDENPVDPGPGLGPPFDVSLYRPTTYDGYDVTYEVAREGGTIEQRVQSLGVDTLEVVDPEVEQVITVDCDVLEQSPLGVGYPTTRTYRADRFVYAIRSGMGETWGEMRYFDPWMTLSPASNPRIGTTFDSGESRTLARYTVNDVDYLEERVFQTWRTYTAIEDSLEVPAGVFHDVLMTDVRQVVAVRVTPIRTPEIVVMDYAYQWTATQWSAPGVGTVREIGELLGDEYEKTFVRGTIAGNEYP
jgi:hypothetical protein